ncbi:hypothetical protein SAMN02745206_02290 [Desulfacinum infernum DSM 9756]|uniref:Uncharacterized protein n=1 Tax=Desulfacinum infernum DSM 9756 TaxID=1121391 RepID=A0A1M5CUZ4_9BACT|nr:hypothetical protein SAMN02745206_02290 [Desulfacinum infernum DSM 9756]
MSPFRAGAAGIRAAATLADWKKRKIRWFTNLQQPVLCGPLLYHLLFWVELGGAPRGPKKTHGSVRDLSAPGRVSKRNASRRKPGKNFRLPGFRLTGWTLRTRGRPTRARGPKSLPGSMTGKCKKNVAPVKSVPRPLLTANAAPFDTLDVLPARPGRRSLRGCGGERKKIQRIKNMAPGSRGRARRQRASHQGSGVFAPCIPSGRRGRPRRTPRRRGSAGFGFPFSGTKIALRGAGDCPPKGLFYVEPSEREKDWKEMS